MLRDRERSTRVTAPRHLARVEAIQLFVVRAQAAAANFNLTSENAAAVAAICERTEGLPLAIELAAARTRVLTPAALLSQLSPQLPLLTDGPSDQPPRLRSMSDAVAWSYDLLSPAEQAHFRRFAVFVGGFTLDAAASVAERGSQVTVMEPGQAPSGTFGSLLDTPFVLELLTALVNQSLIQRTVGVADEARFAMLETVREFGVERLEASGEAHAVADAHADWCLVLAERVDSELSGAQQGIWFDRLEGEWPNFRAALTWLQKRADAERGLRLASALSWFWSSRGYLRDARDWFAVFLAEPTATTPATRAHGLREAGNIAHWRGDGERAVAHYGESLAICRTLGDRYGVGVALRGLGSIAIDHRDLEGAASFLAESGECLRSAGSAWDAAFAIYLAGRLAVAAEKSEEASLRFAEAADAFRAIGNHEYVAAALGQQGAALIRIGDLATARTAYAAALGIAQERNEQSWIAWSVVGAAHLAHARGNLVVTARMLGAATAIRERIGERHQPDDGIATAVRSGLGEERFAVEWRQGATMTELQAVGEARSVLVADDRFLGTLAQARLADCAPLTTREREVLRLLVAGMSDKEIAGALGITRRTASHYVVGIRRKLGVPSRAAAAALAVQDGLLTS